MPKLDRIQTMKCTAMVCQVLIIRSSILVCVCVCVCDSLLVSFFTEEGSDRFHQFLDLLGDEVQLRGWQNFRGGLDNKSRYCWL